MKATARVFLLISIFLSLHLLSVAQEKEETVKKTTTTRRINFFAGVHGGPTYCTYYTNAYTILKQYTLSPKGGCIAGFFVQKNILPHWAWNVELNYELTTYTMTPDKTLRHLPYTGPYYYYNHGQLNRIQIDNHLIRVPLSLEYKITTGRTALFIRAGGYIGTVLRSATHSFYGEKVFDRGYEHDRDWTNPRGIQYGAVGGLGLDCVLNKRLHLIVELRDHVALNNLQNEETNALGVLVGLAY
jgi:hypothetical protein